MAEKEGCTPASQAICSLTERLRLSVPASHHPAIQQSPGLLYLRRLPSRVQTPPYNYPCRKQKRHPVGCLLCFGFDSGILPLATARFLLAPLVGHVGENSPPDCFLPLRSLLVQIPPSLFRQQKNTHFRECFFDGGEGGI